MTDLRNEIPKRAFLNAEVQLKVVIIGGHTVLVNPLVLLWLRVLLVAMIAAGIIVAALAFKRRMA